MSIKNERSSRAVFYTRDSEGKHDQSVMQYVEWAIRKSRELNVPFGGTPDDLRNMIQTAISVQGDLYLDYGITGNTLSRPALDQLRADLKSGREISHVLIPRRDRLARPDHAEEGVAIEKSIRQLGVTIVFMNLTLSPLRRGQRQDLAEQLTSLIDYNESGKFREELAEKMIYAQLQLAHQGYSTGGSPPFGFRRYLRSIDGDLRELIPGETVRQKGSHVLWLPGPETELALIRRIFSMLNTTPAAQVARILNVEGIPSPNTGKRRTDRGHQHVVSGIWHQTTIVNIARNPLCRGVVSYGRRSMGDRRRITPEGPRPLEEEDYRDEKIPKVVQNPESSRITAVATFTPLISEHAATQLDTILEQRSQGQRGKPRSRNPAQNPLGCRIFDWACGWPMYRQPYAKSFRYTCGCYQQSHGQNCAHNHIDGPTAARFALAAIRQRCTSAEAIAAIKRRLRQKLTVKSAEQGAEKVITAKSIALQTLTQQIQTAQRNLAFAASSDDFTAISGVLQQLRNQKSKLEQELNQLQSPQAAGTSVEDKVEAAIKLLAELPELAQDQGNFATLGELFQRLNVQLFLKFQPEQRGKRVLNQLVSGMITVGNAPSPITQYQGATSRQGLKEAAAEVCSAAVSSTADCVFVPKTKSLGNANRDDRI